MADVVAFLFAVHSVFAVISSILCSVLTCAYNVCQSKHTYLVHCESKKGDSITLVCIFNKCSPILKILLLAYCRENLL